MGYFPSDSVARSWSGTAGFTSSDERARRCRRCRKGRCVPFWQRAQARTGALATLPGLEVCFPEVDLLVGEHVGNVGVAGPRGAHVAQLHIEVLAPNEVAERLFPGRFAQKDCGGQAPRCLDPAILASFSSVSPSLHRLPDSQRDSRLLGLRRLAVRFRSEWLLLGEDEFDRGLRSTALYRGATTEARQAVYCEQVLPSVWLDQRVAQRVGLPVDGVVWHYHPVEFLTALDELHREARRSPDTGPLRVRPKTVPAATKATPARKTGPTLCLALGGSCQRKSWPAAIHHTGFAKTTQFTHSELESDEELKFSELKSENIIQYSEQIHSGR